MHLYDSVCQDSGGEEGGPQGQESPGPSTVLKGEMLGSLLTNKVVVKAWEESAEVRESDLGGA